ncbi:hypothetical protein, partial [Kribbella sp. NPDC006257]|uniref:hypothetical protein n=1 Tax=Kribbella sp. NPDC006257 TaxID=3156738 RepID=UPI0033AF01DF
APSRSAGTARTRGGQRTHRARRAHRVRGVRAAHRALLACIVFGLGKGCWGGALGSVGGGWGG